MKYPSLIPKILCKTNIHIVLYGEGLTENGEPIVEFEGDLLCNYQEGAKMVLTDTKKFVEISGKAYFPGDICPDVGVISDGEAVIDTGSLLKRKILKGTKARNPDGTVNFTCLELI